MTTVYAGVLPGDLDAIVRTGLDHGGNAVEPFVDGVDWWLRCCLSHAGPRDRLAIIAYSPFPWRSPYRETGPVVVHADPSDCPGHDGAFPQAFDGVRQVVRAFGTEGGRSRTQIYELNRLVEPGDGLEAVVEGVLDDPRVDRVHVHNVLSQCFSFAASRPDRRGAAQTTSSDW